MKSYLKAERVAEHVYWVGAVDWNVRSFHGYSTEKGTTYNAYLIIDEKVTLIDTVKAPFFDDMMARIASVIDPAKIDYIVSNHSEMDHSGALLPTIQAVKPEKVFASSMGEKALKAHFGNDLKIDVAKTGDVLDLGVGKLSFIETRMLHWPDSMISYYNTDKILFTQDAFGMHFAGSGRFDNQYWPGELKHQAEKYFNNILLLQAPKIIELLDELPKLKLDIRIFAPDHGPIWREDLSFILGIYRRCAEQRPHRKAMVVYDTMWNSTGKMAQSIADGLAASGVNCEVLCLSHCDRSDVMMHMTDCGVVVVGAPTINNNAFPSVIDLLSYMRGLRPKNKIVQAFGSFGWSGEGVKQINEEFAKMGLEIFSDPVSCKYVPDEAKLKECYDLGMKLGKRLLEVAE